MAVSRILSPDFSAAMIIYLPAPVFLASLISSTEFSEKLGLDGPSLSFRPRATIPEDRSGPAVLPLFCLAPHGVFRASRITPRAVSSYLAFSPLPAPLSKNRRCLFCDTLRQRPLSRTLPTSSTWHAAVWCSDFPPANLAIHQRPSAIGGEFITIRN